jgi:hypothetical protein
MTDTSTAANDRAKAVKHPGPGTAPAPAPADASTSAQHPPAAAASTSAQHPPAAAAQAAKPIVREVRPLPVSAYTLINDSSGTFGRVWGATIPANVPWSDLLDDQFWAHKANAFSPMDTIILRHANREYYARLLVLELRTVGTSVEKNRVTVHVLERHDLKPADAGLDSYRALFEISHLGNEKKWCVIRVADRTIVHEGFGSVDDAQLARRMAAQQVAQREAAHRRAGRADS